jgi:hypothetical protein
MSLIEVQWDPTQRQLRQFGVICLFALPLIAWIWGARTQTIGILAGIGLALAVLGYVLPALVKPVFVGLTLITLPIGLVIGEIAMLLIYFGMFLPLSLMFRLVGRDALQVKTNRSASTYWHLKKQPKDTASYYHQS